MSLNMNVDSFVVNADDKTIEIEAHDVESQQSYRLTLPLDSVRMSRLDLTHGDKQIYMVLYATLKKYNVEARVDNENNS